MQIFSKAFNKLPLVAGGGGVAAVVLVTLGVWYYFSPKNLQVGYAPEQPVAYSHAMHAGQLGMDCRYCHANVERSAHAMVPATQTCMGCHALVKADSAKLGPVRASWETGESIAWVKVHVLPDHTYFNHGAHLAAGVGCSTCHGRIDKMEVVRIAEPIAMQWCLACHRDPTPSLRPVDQITNMDWTPEKNPPDWKAPAVRPPTHCSGCHR